MSGFPALLLDIGGVIYKTLPWYEELLYSSLERHLGALGVKVDRGFLERVLSGWRISLDIQQNIVYAAAVVLAEAGVTPSLSRARALAVAMKNAVLSSVYVAEGVYELLEWARSRGLRVGVVSNNWCYECIHQLLVRDGLEHMVDAVVTSDMVGYCKPRREIFEAAFRLLRAEPSRTVFIDDVWENVEGARRAGIGLGIVHDGRPLTDYIPLLEEFYSSR